MTTDKPNILLLSLAYRSYLDETYTTLLNHLLAVSTVKRAKTAPAALRVLQNTTFKAILITDEGLTQPSPANREVLAKIKAYIKAGGLAIIGLHFPNFTNRDQFDHFFKGMGVPWQRGDYTRTTFQFVPEATVPASLRLEALPGPYSMKALHVRGARCQEKMFVPVEGAVTQSLVFGAEGVDEMQAGVVGARIGMGDLVYCGDVNGEEGSDAVMLALCGF
ncbi:hypothetical protein N7466_006123 [Penicillium verhagenii]|uniref:uncharacterized protein n=1 Tax=Penicillium verhagenii TaxID=1562060 RepID=UPI002545B1CE|nr:uncharacterized protein N7466_006123 [Penicillium verhagenii]KAJ5930630.1 hypothetical protein N7466_006123 [Penicillium verhagenii]